MQKKIFFRLLGCNTTAIVPYNINSGMFSKYNTIIHKTECYQAQAPNSVQKYLEGVFNIYLKNQQKEHAFLKKVQNTVNIQGTVLIIIRYYKRI